ncbi:MAG TPA: heme-binding protein [Cyclobacteriaceae bacterium]|nr:heme-binding protein [Cyclobacteriaceae bacterium]
MKKIILIVSFFAPLSSFAQVTNTPSLTLEAAKQIVTEARKYATGVSAPHGGPSIAVVDRGGNLLYLDRPEKTFAGSAMVAYEKAHTAAMFEQPTRNFENKIKEGRTPLVTVGYNMLEGGVPILINGEVVGAIGVSGAASSQQDVEIAEAGAKANLGL